MNLLDLAKGPKRSQVGWTELTARGVLAPHLSIGAQTTSPSSAAELCG